MGLKRNIKFIYTNEQGRAIEFSDDSKIYITEISGLSENNVNLSQASSMNQIGSTVTGQSVEPKTISIDGMFKYDLEKRNQLLAVALPGVTAILRYINEKENIDVFWEVYPKKSPYISWNNVTQHFQLSLLAPYPYARKYQTDITDFNTLHPMHRFKRSYSSTVPFKLSERNYQPLKTIINYGVLPSGFILRMKAMSDNIQAPNLINVKTQEHIKFSNLTLNNGDVIEVNTHTNNHYCKLIKGGEITNIFADMDYDSTFFQLIPGENVVRYGATSNEKSLETSIVFNDVYAGV